MSDEKISELSSFTPVAGDYLVGVDDPGGTPATKRFDWPASLADIAALAVTNGNFIVGNGANWVTESGSTARTSLGLSIGSDVQAWDAQLDDLAALAVTNSNFIVGNGANWATESGSTARTSLGLSIGSDVQAWDAQLDDLAALAVTNSNFIVGNGANFVTESGATARTSLGLGTMATETATDYLLRDGSLAMTGDLDLDDNSINNADDIGFNLSYGGAGGIGVLNWNNTDGTLEVGALGGNVVLQIGQESYVRGINKDGSDINDGEAVTITGSQLQRPKFERSDADNPILHDSVVGLATETILNNAEGYVTTFGIVRGIDTSAWSSGDRIWLDTTPGQLTNVPPAAPARKVYIGTVVVDNAVVGSIFVSPVNVPNLSALSDILVTSIADEDIIWWDAGNSRWKNETLANSLDLKYQPLDAGLTDIAALAVTNSNFIVGNGANWVAESGATARTSLGLGTMAVEAAADYVEVAGDTMAGPLDFNGVADAVVLDADGDTSISAPTGNKIDFETGGGDRMTLTDSGLAVATGARINEFSTDGTLVGDSDIALPTEQAVKTFVETLNSAQVSNLYESDGGGPAVVISADGEMTNATQPMFSAYRSSAATNVTGDGTYYTVIFNTEVFDQGGNYNNATGIFTAPIAGRYFFTAQVMMNVLSSGHTGCSIKIITSNKTFFGGVVNPYATRSATGERTVNIFGMVDMSASHTAYIDFAVSGSTKTVGIYGSTTLYTSFSGGLLA